MCYALVLSDTLFRVPTAAQPVAIASEATVSGTMIPERKYEREV
jgi:hypothetical protein